jgi:hypothetical protein
MSQNVRHDAAEGRVQYRKQEGNTRLYVIYERLVSTTGDVVEEVVIQGFGEVCWVEVPRPDVRELETARRLLAEGRGQNDWQIWLHEAIRECNRTTGRDRAGCRGGPANAHPEPCVNGLG